MLPLVFRMVMTDQKMKSWEQPRQTRDPSYRLSLFFTRCLGQPERLDLLGRQVPQRIQAVSRDHELISAHLDERTGMARRVPGRRQQPHRPITEQIVAPIEGVKGP